VSGRHATASTRNITPYSHFVVGIVAPARVGCLSREYRMIVTLRSIQVRSRRPSSDEVSVDSSANDSNISLWVEADSAFKIFATTSQRRESGRCVRPIVRKDNYDKRGRLPLMLRKATTGRTWHRRKRSTEPAPFRGAISKRDNNRRTGERYEDSHCL
jgi:hypothetical protein